MISIELAGVVYPVEAIRFPGGEMNVRIPPFIEKPFAVFKITAHMTSSDDIMSLLLTVDALRRQHPFTKIEAFIPYVPYARQDRVCNPGEALSIEVMAKLINSCDFTTVTIVDPHSDHAQRLIDNSEVINQRDIFGKLRADWSNIYIVAPDTGAAGKAKKFADHVNAAGLILCSKKRDPESGHLSGFECHADVTGKKLFILDDICDGGGTFIGLRKILEGAASVELAVTHGIFSKGVAVVADNFDAVYTTTSFTGKLIHGRNVTCISI